MQARDDTLVVELHAKVTPSVGTPRQFHLKPVPCRAAPDKVRAAQMFFFHL